MQLKLHPDPDTQRCLIDAAVAERRPVPYQAEIMLRRALGLSDPVYSPPVAHRERTKGGGHASAA